MDRIDRLKAKMHAASVEAFLVSNPKNVFYLSQIKSSNAYILYVDNTLYFYTDGRYLQSARQTANGRFEVLELSSRGILGSLAENANLTKVKKIGFEGNSMTYDQAIGLQALAQFSFVSLNIDSIRCLKDEKEIELTKKAVQIVDEAFEALCSKIKVGMTEKQVERILLDEILTRKATGFSFDTIVASGKRGALPHGVATEKVIESTDFVTIDFGAVYDGYVSDITRTIAMSDKVDSQLTEVFEIVKMAHDLAIEAIKPGVACFEIDKVARDYIASCGYGAYFIHGLGHSFGLEIHEQPYLNPNNKTVLEPGMLVTVEPGIYIPDLGGIRIESDVLITENGYERLSQSDYAMKIIQEESK